MNEYNGQFEMPDIDPSDLQRWNPRYVAAMKTLGALLDLTLEIVDSSTMERFEVLREEYDKLRDSEM